MIQKNSKNIPGTSIPVIKENFTYIKKIDYLIFLGIFKNKLLNLPS